MRRFFKRLFVLLVSLLIVAALAVLAVQYYYNKPGTQGITMIMVPPGSSVRDIGHILEREQLVDSVDAVVLLSRLENHQACVKAGEYAVPPQASIRQIFDLLCSGKQVLREIRVIEGTQSFEILPLFNRAKGLTGPKLDRIEEGSILPDTYFYAAGSNRLNLLRHMQNKQKEFVDKLWQERVRTLIPYKNKQEAVIMASIIEKEAGTNAEMPKIASVFINRLRLGMPLQSDPTTIYALTEGKKRFKRRLLRRDWRYEHPYNTYHIKGLPPGPISHPSRAALRAALKPAETDYIFFVANGRGDHAFSRTYKEHKRNIQKLRAVQRQRRNR